jgi:ferredoxin
VTEYRLVVDSAVCVGHGRCFTLHPALVDSDDAGYPIVREPTVAPKCVLEAQDVVDDCPEQAMSLVPATD